MTSKLSDAEVAAQLRTMGQDIGPMNDATRGVYRRKLDRLLMEQSSLSSVVRKNSPPREPLRMKPQETDVVCNRSVSNNVESYTCDDFEMDDIVEGSLRLEEEGMEEEDAMDGNLIGRREPGFGSGVAWPSIDANNAWKMDFRDSDDGFTTGRNLFSPVVMRAPDLPPAFQWETTQKPASDTSKVVSDDETIRKDKDKDPIGDRYQLSGSFSPALLATPNAPRNQKPTDVGVKQLRQRTAVAAERETTDVAGTQERKTCLSRAAPRPDDYVPSPRDPLSTYLERCTPPPSTAPQSTRRTDRPATIPPENANGRGKLFWIVMFTLLLFCILLLCVLYNMDAGYSSPI